MKTTLPALALCLIACSLLAPMHEQQPSGPPPLPSPPPPQAKPQKPKPLIMGYHPQWPQLSNWLALTNIEIIQLDEWKVVNVSPAQWQRLTNAYPELLETKTLHFYK